MPFVRTRLGVAAAALLVLAPLIVRELRAAPPPGAFALDETATASAAAAVPADAVSIPTLAVGSREVRVGDPAAAAIASLSSVATLAATASDGGAIGRGEIRSYQLDGTNVIVVLEPFETRGALRVAAIYLH